MAKLLVTLICGGNALAQPASHTKGQCGFTDLDPGECDVHVTAPTPVLHLLPRGQGQEPGRPGQDLAHRDCWVQRHLFHGGRGDVPAAWEEGVCLPVALGNKVWDDFNGNGVQDEGKPGMPGVIVTLSDKNGNLMMELATSAEAITITAADGSYWFTGLVPGEYGHPQSTQALGSTSAIIALTAAPLAPVVHGTHLPMALYHTPANVCAPRSVGLLPQATNTLTATLLAPPIMSIPFQCLAQTQQRGA